ncbi:MAG: alpha/beta hydrolase [Clostridiaceae bacterium]|jgi:acetyl esterase/lipase|nr:alpha/beta hydrolase [Clostridiaceae bacterium]
MDSQKLVDAIKKIRAKMPTIGELAEKSFIKRGELDKFYLFPKARLHLDEWIGYCTLFNVNKAKDVEYVRKIRYADGDENLYLNVCRPQNRTAGQKLPVFVYIHGGGWVSGRPEDREAFVSRIASAGFFTVNVFYGYSPEYPHPLPVANIYRALKWLRTQIDFPEADTDEIWLGGESAGAHLAAIAGAASANPEYRELLALDEEYGEIKFKGLVLNCGVYDIETALESGFKYISSYVYAYYGRPLEEMEEDVYAITMSPVYFVTGAFPKTFLVTAQNDPLKGCGALMRDKLSECGVAFEHFHGDGAAAVHAFAVSQAFDISKEAMNRILRFMGKEEQYIVEGTPEYEIEIAEGSVQSITGAAETPQDGDSV